MICCAPQKGAQFFCVKQLKKEKFTYISRNFVEWQKLHHSIYIYKLN